MDHFRAGRRWQPESDVPERIHDLAPSAEEAAFHTIDRERMLGLIRGLSPDQQQVLTLRYVFDFSNSEAAEIMGKNENAIKQLQHRAIGSLQRRLAPA
jgi:RNA polymerase sigma-70 factor (ECF subfamily)